MTNTSNTISTLKEHLLLFDRYITYYTSLNVVLLLRLSCVYLLFFASNRLKPQIASNLKLPQIASNLKLPQTSNYLKVPQIASNLKFSPHTELFRISRKPQKRLFPNNFRLFPENSRPPEKDAAGRGTKVLAARPDGR